MTNRYEEQQQQLDRFQKWAKNAKETASAELDLLDLAVEYQSQYFKDLTLEDKRIHSKLLAWETDESERFKDPGDEFPEYSISDRWMFHYRRLPERYGECDDKERTITIRTGIVDEQLKVTLLHEMIHAYEEMLPSVYQEWLLLDLYRRSKGRIGEQEVHRLIDAHLSEVIRSHGVLFLLKSLELDERLGRKRGTVFDYGRDELFE